MTGYGTSDVARLLGMSARDVRAYARAGILDARRTGPGRTWRFSFQDLVLLRTAKGLRDARVAPRRIRRALEKLKAELPRGRALSELRITAEGDEVVVRDGRAAWSPESGQLQLDFTVADLAGDVAPLPRPEPSALHADADADAETWYHRALDLEAHDPARAREAYARALARAPAHVEAHINLGRLLQESGAAEEAERHYREALSAQPGHATALYNLGTVLEDRGRIEHAVAAYEAALSAEPDLADAHFNLSRLYERLGDARAALRHLSRYRELTAAS